MASENDRDVKAHAISECHKWPSRPCPAVCSSAPMTVPDHDLRRKSAGFAHGGTDDAVPIDMVIRIWIAIAIAWSRLRVEIS